MTIGLRPYQLQMVREISAHYQGGAKGVMLRCPTGGGKTRTASYIVERYVTTGRQMLWLVDQEELLDQAAMTFAEYGIEHHLLCSDSARRSISAHEFLEHGRSFVKTGAQAIVASVQTLVRRLDGQAWSESGALRWLNPAQIIADEADLSLATTWRRVIGYWPEARLLGLTATPVRMDRQSFAREDGGLYDSMVIGPTESWLIDHGYLARYTAYKPDVHLVEGVADLSKLKGGDYDPQELERELDAPKVYGDVVEHYRTHCDRLPAIAFCPTVTSAERFAAAFRAAGYRAQALDGMTDDGVRRRAVKALGCGEMDVLTGVNLLVKGVDIPLATVAIWLRRTKSRRIFMQGTGRVLRPHPSKGRAILLDCVGVIKEHGLPHWDHPWSLKPAERKASASSAEEPEPGIDSITNCLACRAYHLPAPACPHCGHEYPKTSRREAQQVDAQLVEITEAEAERMRRARRVAQGQAKSVPELVAQGIGRARALKIVAAREAKSRLVGQVLDAIEAAGRPAWQVCGMTAADLARAKPAELKAALERAKAHGCENLVA